MAPAPLCAGCCAWFTPKPASAPVASGGTTTTAPASNGSMTPGEPAPQQQREGGCAQSGSFLRNYFWFFVASIILMIIIGIVLLVMGVLNIVDGENSTTGAEFLKRNALYASNSKAEITSATGTVTVGSSSTTTALSGAEFTSNYQLSGAAKTWDDAFITVILPRTLFPTTGTVSFGLSLDYTCAECTTGATKAPVAQFSSTPFSVSNGTGWFVRDACVVIGRTHKNTAFELDAEKATCFYPFDSDSNKYTQATSTTVTLTVRSKFDFGYYYLEEESSGSLNMEDKDIILVDPNTPSFLGAGAALLVIGVALLCALCCCFRGGDKESSTVAPV